MVVSVIFLCWIVFALFLFVSLLLTNSLLLMCLCFLHKTHSSNLEIYHPSTKHNAYGAKEDPLARK